MNKSETEAGFRDDAEDILEQPEDQERAVRLSEIKQLLVPISAELPEDFEKLTYRCADLADLGDAIQKSFLSEEPLIFLALANDVAAVALQYPTMFRLKPAVLKNVPGVEYEPRFNQAVFGLTEVNWSYLVEAMGLDERLRFTTQADLKSGPAEEDDNPEVYA